METLETNPITLRSIVAAPTLEDNNSQHYVSGFSKVSKLSDSGYNSVSKQSGLSFRNNSETRNAVFRSFENEQPELESQISHDELQKAKSVTEIKAKSNSAPWRYNKTNSFDLIQKSSQESVFKEQAQIRQRPNMNFDTPKSTSSIPQKSSTFSSARSGQKQSIDDLIKKFHVNFSSKVSIKYIFSRDQRPVSHKKQRTGCLRLCKESRKNLASRAESRLLKIYPR